MEGGNPRGRMAQVVALMVLAPVCAEYLAAYDASTGDPGELLLGLLFLAPLYGAAAVIIREVVRRAGLGWGAMIAMSAAFGVLQAGVIDQSLFSIDYRGIEGWEEGRRGTLIEPLGISAYQAQLFIVGHVIYSICAPIALIEALRPGSQNEPWLGNIGLAVIAVLYVGASAFVLVYHLTHEASHASPTQVVTSLLIVGGLIVAAFKLGRGARGDVNRHTPRPRTVFVVSFVAATLLNCVPETWLGFGVAVAVLAVSAACLARTTQASAWAIRHNVSVAAGTLVSRALLAFTYYPVLGDVTAVAKYLHNVVLLATIVVVWALAARSASELRDES